MSVAKAIRHRHHFLAPRRDRSGFIFSVGLSAVPESLESQEEPFP
jgi:hypothetical protein